QLLMDLVPAETRGLTRALLEQGQYNCFIPREAWQAAFTDAELKEQALTLPSTWAHAAYELVRNPDPAFVRAFISNPANQWGHVIEYDVGVAQAAENYDVLTRAGKLILVDAGARRGALGLTDLMAKETDPCVVQEILFADKRLETLIASIDQHGACQGNAFWRDWQWEKKAAADYPDSFLARGIKAWEAVRGTEGLYFSDGRFYTQRYRFPVYDSAAVGYDPEREIPAWLDFLSRYSNHPAADDGAYRLARSYEIQGDFVQALRWLVRTAELPDGEFVRQARGRITWILDALLTDEQLATLDPAALPGELKPQLDYARALRLLRAGRYDEALPALDALLVTYGAQPAGKWDGSGQETWDSLLRTQRAQVARLAELARRTDPEGRYALGALMFHDDMLFRNLLFRFGVGPGFIGGHSTFALTGDYDEQYGVWAGDQNNYVQAARVFATITEGPEEILAKAAYSRALALATLTGPGSYIDLWQNQREIGLEAATLFEAMANRFPESDLADDALLSVAYLRQDPVYFDRIVQQYPESDMAADARLRSFAGSYGIPNGMIPFRYLRSGEAPPAVAAWVKEHLGAPYTGTMDADGYTYILVVAKPGERAYIYLGVDASQVTVRPAYGLLNGQPERAWSLIRIKSQPRPIVFDH
ncbi:MAG TPA: hypothetical protein VNT75_02605, partial [Symbiobacteriaceae bacterium]|nr:hypothetical protein [Symbiobacteriaceae bacterium]